MFWAICETEKCKPVVIPFVIKLSGSEDNVARKT